MQDRVAVVILARNEEKFLGNTLSALMAQDLVPPKIIVVNDGSTDRTREVSLEFDKVEVVDIEEKRGYSALAHPELAKVINRGLEYLKDSAGEKARKFKEGGGSFNYEYVVILAADHVLPPNYLSSIITEMEKDKRIAVCSGVIEGEKSNILVPRGSGRVVRTEFWEKLGFRYPVKFGYETYLLIKALQLGYRNIVLQNLVSTTQRKTGGNYRRKTYIGQGKALKALGTSVPYCIINIGRRALENPLSAIYMLKGYLSNDVELYEADFRNYLKVIQNRRLRQHLGL
jgi:cellulose synthase/poly-beta-1,6-N-acetylglucosamine synthase-like glycosyltransferase